MTYTLIPTGGVITPISVTSTIITPNQIGSKSKSITTGSRIGIVSVISANESIKQTPMR
jgi:hypothetical protein